MGDTTVPDSPEHFSTAYQPPRLRINAAYEPHDDRRPTQVEIEVYDDAPLTPAVIHEIVTRLAGVISGPAENLFPAATDPASSPAGTLPRTVNSAKFNLIPGRAT